MYALNLETDGRILSATFQEYAPQNAVNVEILPEGNLYEYIYKDGEYIHDPLPETENSEQLPTLEDRVSDMENKTSDLATALEMILNGVTE